MDHVKTIYRELHKIMIQKWVAELSQRLNRPVEHIIENGLCAYDFTTNEVTVEFVDTYMRFRSAFLLINEERNEIAVFSEHSGYHEFYAEKIQAQELRPIDGLRR